MKLKLNKVIFVFALKVALVGLGFVLMLLLAKTLDTSALGDYFWLLSFSSLVVTFLRFGRDNRLIKQIAAAESDYERINYAAQASRFILISSALYMPTVACLLMFLEYSMAFKLSLVILPPILVFISIQGYLLQSVGLAHWQQVYTHVPKLVAGFGFIALISVTDLATYFEGISDVKFSEFDRLLYCLLLSSLTMAAVSAYHTKKSNLWRLKLGPSEPMVRPYVPFFIISLSATIMAEGAMILLGWLSDSEQVALFGVASRVVALLAFFIVALNAILMPSFSSLAKKGKYAEVRRLFQDGRNKSTVVACLLAFILLILSPYILRLFGPQFEPAFQVIALLLIVQIMKVAFGPVGQLLMMSGHAKKQRRAIVTGVSILVVMSSVLMPIMGAMGAACSVFLAVLSNNAVGFYYCRKLHHIPLFPFTTVREVL